MTLAAIHSLEASLWPASWRMTQYPRILLLPASADHMVHNHQPDPQLKEPIAEMQNDHVFFCIRARNLPQCSLKHYEVRIYNGLPYVFFQGKESAPIWNKDQLNFLLTYVQYKQNKRQMPKLVIQGGVPHESHISSYLHLFLAPFEAQVWDLPDFLLPLWPATKPALNPPSQGDRHNAVEAQVVEGL